MAIALNFEEFALRVVQELDLDVAAHGELREATLLFEDLGLDSLSAYELIYVTEELAGVQGIAQGLMANTPEFEPILTLGNAYAYYNDLFKGA